MRSISSTGVLAALFSLSLMACGPSSGDDADGGPGDIDAGTGDPCTEGTTRCVGQTFQTCVDGFYQNQQACPLVCDDALGCVACDPDMGNVCQGDEIHQCNGDGTIGSLVDTCPPGTCTAGHCVDLCAEAAASNSYIGCEYWPVDLHNAIEVYGPANPILGCLLPEGSVAETHEVCYDSATSLTAGLCDPGSDCTAAGASYACESQNVCVHNAQSSPFAIVVSNPHSDAVTVTLSNQGGTTQDISVAANSVHAIYPQDLGFTDQSIPGPGKHTLAYKLTSPKPVVAYQFNPLNNVGVFSNDGSLLIPQHTYGTKYYAVTAPTLTRRPSTHDYNGYVTIVASAEGQTTIDVTPSCDTLAGDGGVPAITAGSMQQFTLSQWETLTLEAVAGAEGSLGGDLTGTLIENTTDDKTFSVFVGHEAMAMSVGGDLCCADHLEDQAFPASTWGTVYAVARSEQRTTEPDRIRVIAQRDGTSVTVSPAGSAACPTLNAGDFCEFDISGDTEIAANDEHPIMVAQMLLSTGGEAGDPALAFAVPTEQYRNEYSLLVPEEYANNYFAVVAPTDGTVSLDSTDVTSQLANFGSGTYKAGRLSVNAGPHTLSCPLGCGVLVMGYDEAVSYLFAGGLDLNQIVVD